MRIRVNPDDIIIGKPLPWDLYNADGRRIFRSGFVINTEDSRKRILAIELYFEPTPGASTPPPSTVAASPAAPAAPAFQPKADAGARRRSIHYDFKLSQQSVPQQIGANFFSFLDYCVAQEQSICEAICSGAKDKRQDLQSLIENVLRLYNMSPDACLGAVHLEFEHPFSSLQPVYTALLCLTVAHGLRLDPATTRSLVGAALTANLGMFEFFDYIVNKKGMLSDEEKQFIQNHPELSYRLLHANGINDTRWLTTVLQHHERNDGTGYPQRLKGDAICSEASVLATVDTYLSMVMPRAYRKALSPKAAMQKIYTTAVASHDTLSVGLIKQLGIYPPGSLVRLFSQEIAVVLERNLENSLAPKVACLGQLGGAGYPRPILRDTESPNYRVIDAFVSDEPIEVDMNELWGRDVVVDYRVTR